MNTRVVHCKKEYYDIYIGRGRCPRTGKLNDWGNPFVVGQHGTRDEVIKLFEEYIRRTPWLIKKLPDLKGKILGCWCHPKSCHGDVLVKLADELG